MMTAVLPPTLLLLALVAVVQAPDPGHVPAGSGQCCSFNGHGNFSAKQLRRAAKHTALTLAGFSAPSCGPRCQALEPEYAKFAAAWPRERGLLFARVDVDKHRSPIGRYGLESLPALVLFRKGRTEFAKYDGAHTAAALGEYAAKVTGSPVATLATAQAAADFAAAHTENATVLVAAFKRARGDEYEEWRAAAEVLSMRAGVWLGEVIGADAAAAMKAAPRRWLQRTPALVLFRRKEAGDGAHEQPAWVALEELSSGIEDWVGKAAIPLVGQLSPMTFAQYERLLLPMVLLFLEYDAKGKPLPASAAALEALWTVARRYRGRLVFLRGDGKKYAQKRKVLGLHGGALPAMSINTNDGRTLPFSRGSFSQLEIESYVKSYLSGSIAAKTAGVDSRAEKGSPKPMQPLSGVRGDAHADAFSDARQGDSVVPCTSDNLADTVLDRYSDVLLLLQSHDSADCQSFYRYVKRASDRFAVLGVKSVKVAKFDVERHVLPAALSIQYTSLPTLVFFPAKSKGPPYRYYSGKGKAQHLMWFAQQHASYKFELPDEPHLTREQAKLKEKQLAERAARLKEL